MHKILFPRVVVVNILTSKATAVEEIGQMDTTI